MSAKIEAQPEVAEAPEDEAPRASLNQVNRAFRAVRRAQDEVNRPALIAALDDLAREASTQAERFRALDAQA